MAIQDIQQRLQALHLSPMTTPTSVTLVEVGPRDGLQNESTVITADQKISLIDQLSASGLSIIESGSFVSPRWVPQMADTDAVFKGIQRNPTTRYSALAPNMRGLTDAISANADEIAVFGAVTESFSQKNINCSIDESLLRFQPVIETALAENIPVRGYLSCVLGCPYEGQVDYQQVLRLTRHLLDAGCYEVSLGDTIGVGTPADVEQLLTLLLAEIPVDKLAVHFHDTYGQAIANVHASLKLGIHVIDSAVGGLGGCPYAKGASGNVATEDVVYLLQGMNISSGVDLDLLVDTAVYISNVLGRPLSSKVGNAVVGSRQSAESS